MNDLAEAIASLTDADADRMGRAAFRLSHAAHDAGKPERGRVFHALGVVLLDHADAARRDFEGIVIDGDGKGAIVAGEFRIEDHE